MTQGIRGFPLTLEGSYPSIPADPTVLVIDPNDVEVETGVPTPASEGSLNYVYEWNVPDSAAPGDYIIQWGGTVDGGPSFGAEGFEIVPDTLTMDQWAYLRSQVGNGVPPTDAQLAQALTRLGTAEKVALEVLQGRYATLLAGHSEVRVDGDISWKTSDRLLAAVAASVSSVSDSVTGGTGLLRRTDRER